MSSAGLLRYLLLSTCLCLFLICLSQAALASPQFSAQTGASCQTCHENPDGGPTLTETGLAFRHNGYSAESLKELSPWSSLPYFFLGFVHILAGIIWFGTIFYVHLVIRPKTYTGGLPSSEIWLGRSCIILVAVTGVVLSIWRLPAWESIWTSTFGIIWLIKVSAFICMFLVASVVTTWLNKKMREYSTVKGPLAGKDGQQGRPAYIIFQGTIYDLTQSKMWKDGQHMKRHQAGTDLTDAISGAPHGTEVLERFPSLGEIEDIKSQMPWPHRVFLFLSYLVLALMLVILLCIGYWNYGPPLTAFAQPERVQARAQACLHCHSHITPGIYQDWRMSLHARSKISCYHCHAAKASDPDVVPEHPQNIDELELSLPDNELQTPVATLVSPKDCSHCHPVESEQYSRSKHANTLKIIWSIDPWLNQGMNSNWERASGCFYCHGSVVKVKNGQLDPLTWPNVGVGRINPDGSKGSCTTCHTRHRFSVQEARRPGSCGQCHLGPDHPQKEIYKESKHGNITMVFGDDYNWNAAPGTWTPGVDYRAPTCASCHMSGSGDVATTHDVTERLSWETQAPLTIRPSQFKPLPARTNWQQEREKMKKICRNCHADVWINDHYFRLDKTVQEYNEAYFLPAKKLIDQLYEKGLLDKTKMFDEKLEVEFYELWHQEGRRARMGAAMMAPDYAWWHGFYECKKRFNEIMAEGGHLLETGQKAYKYKDYPNDTGDTRWTR